MKKILLSIIAVSLTTGCAEIRRAEIERQEYLQKQEEDKCNASWEIQHQYKTFSVNVLYQIEKNPSKYYGSLAAFYGRVIQAAETNEETVLQILTKNIGWSCREYGCSESTAITSSNWGSSLIIVFKKTNIPVIKNSYVKVLGYMGPPVEGYNAFGTTVSSLTIKAVAIAQPRNYVLLQEDIVYYDEKDEAMVEQWKSGELISSQ